MVGPKPNKSMNVKRITAHIGSEVKYQKGKEAKAEQKNNQSDRVIKASALFKKAKYATPIVKIPDTPIGHAPIPPFASN